MNFDNNIPSSQNCHRLESTRFKHCFGTDSTLLDNCSVMCELIILNRAWIFKGLVYNLGLDWTFPTWTSIYLTWDLLLT